MVGSRRPERPRSRLEGLILTVVGIIAAVSLLGGTLKAAIDHWTWIGTLFQPDHPSPGPGPDNECGNLPPDACQTLRDRYRSAK
jgi:hypothetical protein